jgi:hypothetical protein
MADPHSIVFRPNNQAFENSLKESRQCIAESIRVLRDNEPPDTFLGRKRYELILPYPENDTVKHHRQ